jgi:hypothetical protein
VTLVRPSHHREENEDEHDAPEKEREDAREEASLLALAAALLLVLRRRFHRALFGFFGRRLELLDHRIGARDDAARHVACPEAGQNRILDDQAGESVGEDRLEAVTHLDTHLLFLGSDDQDRSVVRLALPDSPASSQAIAIFLDWIVLKVGNRRHHELARARLL